MPLVDYGDEPEDVAPPSVRVPDQEDLRYLEPVCPSRAKRKPRPDLVALYKLQEQGRLAEYGEAPLPKASPPTADVNDGDTTAKPQLRHSHSDDEHTKGPRPKRQRRASTKGKK